MPWTFDDEPSGRQLIELSFCEPEGSTTVVMINSGISAATSGSPSPTPPPPSPQTTNNDQPDGSPIASTTHTATSPP